MSSWISALAEVEAGGEPAVLVTVLSAEGSTPREAGVKMVVTLEGQRGTIGGGHLELTALTEARALLEAHGEGAVARPVLRDYPLGPSLGQCCGGRVSLLLEVVARPSWRVALFGAGHVGSALVRLLEGLPCAVDWIDSREEARPAELGARVRFKVVDPPAEAVAGLPPGSDVVVMTHSHDLDQAVVEAALRRPELGFVGLIGSRTKRARFEARLGARGLPPEVLARLTCPVGLPGVGGKNPSEIAIAVAAQLLQRRGSEATE